LFFAKYNQRGASSRYRIYNYLDFYKNRGFIVDINYLFGDWHFNKSKFLIYFVRLSASFLRRMLVVFNAKKYDLVYIEYELFPYFPAFIEKLFKVFKIKFIVDYDDAIFHTYNLSSNPLIKIFLEKKIDNLISSANFVITGSPYLTNYALQFTSRLIEIPTSLDQDVYHSTKLNAVGGIFTIGWIGSHSTSVNVLDLIPVFRRINDTVDFQLNLIGFDIRFRSLFEGIKVNFIDWSSETEITEIHKFDVGIMPLKINPWNRGKCGFKLIQYMACSKPTISTPLETNLKINRGGNNLFASSENDWYHAILTIYNDRDYYSKVGKDNYRTFLLHYNTRINFQRYIEVFKSV
jgi:glycosyltransferase involved in cell wall biosynthesis